MTNTARYLLAAILLLLAIGCVLIPNRKEETALRTSNVVSSVPSKERLATEWTARTTIPRASRSRSSAPVRPAPAPRARTAPTPRITAAPAPVGAIQEAICNAFGRACAWALRVAKCESGYRPNATNGQFRGLFQVGVRIHAARIARMGFAPEQMWEAGPNIQVALAIYSESGGRAWQCK